jgi:hypothetical protein
MLRSIRAFAFALTAVALVFVTASADEKKDEKKSERLRTVIDVTASFDKDKKTLTVVATGQVPTGGWSGAKLTPRKTTEAPKDGVYEFDLTAVRPDGIVTQVISKVKAEYKWENPPADLKGVKVYGDEKGAKTVKVEK